MEHKQQGNAFPTRPTTVRAKGYHLPEYGKPAYSADFPFFDIKTSAGNCFFHYSTLLIYP
jgi:hypothetical protein